MTFNGKSKNTSQLFYNTAQDTPEEIYDKVRVVIEDYFKWYSGFQNKEIIKEVHLFSSDFVCTNKCKLNSTHRINIAGSLLNPPAIIQILQESGEKYGIQVEVSVISLTQ